MQNTDPVHVNVVYDLRAAVNAQVISPPLHDICPYCQGIYEGRAVELS